METNYTFIKQHTLMEIIEDTLNKILYSNDYEEAERQAEFLLWLLKERGEKNVQLPEN